MKSLDEFYHLLYNQYGNTGWWPASSRDEVIVGAILTQNTSWTNVEKAIGRMKEAGIINIQEICGSELNLLEQLIRSSGFYHQKAARLKQIACRILENYGSVEEMMIRSTEEISKFLSGMKGVGQETLDSILLYSLDKPVFVVDKYTIRIFERIGITKNPDIASVKRAVHEYLDNDVEKLKNLHGMIVYLGKDYCRTKPLCHSCPLQEHCDYGSQRNHAVS